MVRICGVKVEELVRKVLTLFVVEGWMGMDGKLGIIALMGIGMLIEGFWILCQNYSLEWGS